MSMSRSPSPPDSPSLEDSKVDSKRNSRKAKSYGQLNGGFSRGVTWASAQSRSAQVRRHNSRGQGGFFNTKLGRKLSWSLPVFDQRDYSDKEKLGRGRWATILQNLIAVMIRGAYRFRRPLAILIAIIMSLILFYATPLKYWYRRTSSLGGGNKFVVILGANPGGGVMELKGAREWAVERDSVRNKRKYTRTWGYTLEIVDMVTKKRYAHEWRESWEKADTIRRCMRDYPEAEWFWWLDLNTFVMEHSYSLQEHIFNNLGKNTYRDINEYNPLNVQHPFTQPYLDEISRSPTGDNDPSSINLLVAQDCSGFNLGSFFMRRSAWSDRLLDIWWDPVHYEQKHMQWEHKEQDALEYLYRNHPWIRAGVGFLPQRRACSFPPGACGTGHNETIHYNVKDRDFLVNFAGCEWGRDCWAEMYRFRELSNFLNRSPWEKFKEGISGAALWAIGRKPKVPVWKIKDTGAGTVQQNKAES